MTRTALDPENHHVNRVLLVGRVSAEPELRSLPSGDPLWTARVVVSRHPPTQSTRRVVDTVDCAAWTARVQRSVSRWRAGDLVEVEGSLRRRFYGPAGQKASRVEVEVGRARVIRRATS